MCMYVCVCACVIRKCFDWITYSDIVCRIWIRNLYVCNLCVIKALKVLDDHKHALNRFRVRYIMFIDIKNSVKSDCSFLYSYTLCMKLSVWYAYANFEHVHVYVRIFVSVFRDWTQLRDVGLICVCENWHETGSL